MKKMVVLASAVLMSLFASAAELSVSDGDIVLGQWNSNFTAGKAYAEANSIPMLIFWGNEGCGYCGLLKKAMLKDDFISWSASKQIIMIACEGKDTTEAYKCWEFAKNSSGLFPYVCVYWPKSSGNVEVRFSGRSNKIPVSIGTLGEKLMTYVDQLTTGYTPGDTPTPTPTPEPEPEPTDVFNGNINPVGVLYDARTNIAGIVSLKCKAPRKGYSTVSGTVQMLNGVKKSVRSTKVATGSAVTATLKVTTLGSMTLKFTASSISGTLGGYSVVPMTVGGSLGGNYNFDCEFDKSFEPATGYSLVDELLPSNRVVSTSAEAINFGTYKVVKYSKVNGSWQLVNADCENPCKIKVRYNATTGYIYGTMYIYSNKVNQRTGRPTLKRSSAKVYGAVVDGVGVLFVYVKGTLVGTATLTK